MGQGGVCGTARRAVAVLLSRLSNSGKVPPPDGPTSGPPLHWCKGGCAAPSLGSEALDHLPRGGEAGLCSRPPTLSRALLLCCAVVVYSCSNCPAVRFALRFNGSILLCEKGPSKRAVR